MHSEDFLNPDYCYDIEDFEYHDEETDILWVEENWFESVTDADVSWVIMDKIIAWAEIPEVNL